MKFPIKKIYFVLLAIIVLNPFYKVSAQKKVFKVVIDAGHGGHDTGTRGTGKMKKKEKDIALAVAKKVAAKLKKYPDIKPILTRDKDIFLELHQRAKIANKNKADVFISIHCNANKSSRANGSETFVLGIHRNKDNLTVAKRENSVIKLEKNNQLHYEGFDPSHPESFIGLTLLQEEFLDQSILLASFIQKEYQKRVNIKDRSVQQAGFAVLRLTYMPSVLTEIGFLSNPKEEKFLNSKAGQDKIATSIANAIVAYKKYIKANTPDVTQTQKTETVNQPVNKPKIFKGVTFKVQLAASKKKLALIPENFNGLKDISVVKVGEWYKYYTGNTSDYTEIKKIKKIARDKSFITAFIVAYKNGKRVDLKDVLNRNSKI